MIHEINGGLGNDIHLYPHQDFAILLSSTKPDQAYLPVSYADVQIGSEIGVAGYPLATLSTDSSGSITLGGIVYRVADGVANAIYKTDVDSGDGHPLKDTTVVEVNFLFVPGNSGGPIFEARTRKGHRICERIQNSQNPRTRRTLQFDTSAKWSVGKLFR